MDVVFSVSFGCVSMCSALLLFLRSRLLLYSAGSVVNRVMSPLPDFCYLSVRTVVNLCTLGVFALVVSLVS